MTPTRCEQLIEETQDSLEEARRLGLPDWEKALVKRLHSLSDLDRRILRRETEMGTGWRQ